MEKAGAPQDNYLKSLGSRILCELNDLKRTPETAAKELGIPDSQLQLVLDGSADEKEAHNLIRKMGQLYPIDHLQMHLIRDDTINGIRFVSASESKSSKRIYNRVNSSGTLAEYYEYRDTAMSKLSLFKPEWISVLREVSDSSPNNPDVVMNNGHFMHQVTLFMGPVNFYYEDSKGVKHCREMNTGDSNYITPFVKHSFASRDKSEFTCILAVTFGADVCRAQRELYALGEDVLNSYKIDCKETGKSSRQLIKQYMKNNLFTISILDSLIEKGNIDIEEVLSSNREISMKEYEVIANALGVNVVDILDSTYEPEQECVIKYISDNVPSVYLNGNHKIYNVYTLAKTLKIPSMTNSIIEVLSNKHTTGEWLQKSLHAYIINFSDCPVELVWRYNGSTFVKTIHKYDSVYLKPFIEFSFANKGNNKGSLMVVGIPSSVGLQAQKELSTLMEPNRVINELGGWYDY